MNALRLIDRLKHAEERFDAEVSKIIADAGANDAAAVVGLRAQVKRKYAKHWKGANAGFKYTAQHPHWMQKPENRAKVARMAKERGARRRRQ